MNSIHTKLLPIAVAALLIATSGLAQIRKGRWDQKSDIAEGWVVHNSRYFQVQSQCGLEKAERLADHMETMLQVYVELFRPNRSMPTTPYPIKLFESKRLYMAYGRVGESAAAYYSRTDGEMVCYDTGRWMDEEDERVAPVTGDPGDEAQTRVAELRYQMDLLGTAAHEGWHQYFAWYVGSWVSMPSWINEGMGDYFYAARPMQEGQKRTVRRGRMNDARLPIIKWAVENDRTVPLDQFVHYSQNDYYADAGVCYAQGWALCQFLLHSGNKRYEKVIPTYVRIVRSDTNMAKVTEQAFKGIDLKQLDEEFKQWIKGLEMPGEAESAGEAAGGVDDEKKSVRDDESEHCGG